MPDLKAIYRAETAEAGAAELDNFEAQWGKRYPAIGQAWRRAWRRAWEYVVPLFAFPSAIRKMIYTTHAVESLHRSLRKIIKTRGSFPTDEAALKLLFLAIRNAGVKWRRRVEGGQRRWGNLPSCLATVLSLQRAEGSKPVISDAHGGLRHAITRVLGATWQRCPVHWMRNALAHVPRAGTPWSPPQSARPSCKPMPRPRIKPGGTSPINSGRAGPSWPR